MFQFLRRVLFLLNLLLVVYTLLVYQLSYTATVQHWLGGFIMLSMPIVLLLNLIFLFFWLLIGSKRWILSLGCLLLGYPFLVRTFHFNNPFKKNTTAQEKNISVLSYNLMWCDADKFFMEHDTANALAIINTAIETDADIKCFQELYNNDANGWFQLIKKLQEKNPYYTYIHATEGNDKGQGFIGMSIFSKYPLIDKKEIYWVVNNNGILSVDLLITKKDTLRVINTQLHSMGVRVEKVIQNRNNEAIAKKEAKNIFHQLKDGFVRRAEQVKDLENIVKESKYPTIVCGDFNELPYGYAYGRIRNHLKNAFEEKGVGFGFTYNKAPNFIRIDNQFFSKELIINKFQTLSTKKYSDHYPIYGEYSLAK